MSPANTLPDLDSDITAVSAEIDALSAKPHSLILRKGTLVHQQPDENSYRITYRK